jgi:protein-L-isoaspartate(D-aspartate) O-methyltransferase
MVAGLLERGELSPPWREAFDHVARHEFIPDTMWQLDRRITDGPDLVPVGRAQDPGAWLVEAYKNVGVATQVDDGHPDEHSRGREITSSASMPAVVAQMLTALDVRPGMRVLEIGTGTGYNAALLAYRLGAEKVTSVEIDSTLAELARARLRAAGFGGVSVVTGDGAAGHRAGAPYDRVLATVAVRTVPYAWITQTRPGGIVLTPWGSEWYNSALLKLTVTQVSGSGVIGRGRIVGPAAFMTLRAQRTSRWGVRKILGRGQADTTTTELHPSRVVHPNPGTAIGLALPGVQQFYTPAPDGGLGTLNVIDQTSASWAAVTLAEQPPYKVEQAGPRQLWTEVETAYQHWREDGKPAAEDWTVAISPNGQTVTL